MDHIDIHIEGLLPCPFCAGNATIHRFGDRVYSAYCKNKRCGAEAPGDSVSVNGAKIIWNKRKYKN